MIRLLAAHVPTEVPELRRAADPASLDFLPWRAAAGRDLYTFLSSRGDEGAPFGGSSLAAISAGLSCKTMSVTAVPDDIRQFLLRYVDRLETLDVLLLLCRTPDRSWSPAEVSAEMRSSPTAAAHVLRSLASHRILREESGRYRFDQESTDLADMTARLAACYREKRTGIIAVIFSRPTTISGG